MNEHISSAYDRDLEEIQSLIMKMGGMVEHAILESAKALEVRDIERADVVRKGDKAIDALEEQINEACPCVQRPARAVIGFETVRVTGTGRGLRQKHSQTHANPCGSKAD